MEKLVLLAVGFSAGILVAAYFYSRRDRIERQTIWYGKGWQKEMEAFERIVERAENKQRKPQNN